jgi:hypothetical protein
MEAPRDIQESKRFRWVGRPSEEELLGMHTAAPTRTAASASPRPLRAPRLVTTADAFHDPPRGRFQRRDLALLAAVACAIWFAVRGTEGLPFHALPVLEPAEASDVVGAGVALDRQELASLPRRSAAAATAPGTSPTSSEGRSQGSGKGSGSGSDSGAKDDPKPPPTKTSDPPLLQANIPGVGSVTVDKPDLPLPSDTPDLPLPDTGDLVGTTTITLP